MTDLEKAYEKLRPLQIKVLQLLEESRPRQFVRCSRLEYAAISMNSLHRTPPLVQWIDGGSWFCSGFVITEAGKKALAIWNSKGGA